MIANGDADAMVTGVTRVFSVAFNQVMHVIDPLPNRQPIGISLVVRRDRSFFIADTNSVWCKAINV